MVCITTHYTSCFYWKRSKADRYKRCKGEHGPSKSSGANRGKTCIAYGGCASKNAIDSQQKASNGTG